ncbi:hypothetical protein Tco_0347541 [Tanacetum coccineum]
MRGIVRLVDARKVFDEMSVKDTCEGSGSKLGAPFGHLSGDCDSDVDSVDEVVESVVMAPKVRIFSDDEGDDRVEDEGVFSGDDSSCMSELNQSMDDEGWKVECLNEVVKVSESDEMSFDLGSSVEIVSCSGNDIAIETNSGSEQEVVFDCCGNQSKKMVDQKEREMVAMEADMAPELAKLNEMSNTVNESEPDVVDVYRTESKNRLSELEEEMTVTNVDVITKHIPLVVMKVRISVILKN